MRSPSEWQSYFDHRFPEGALVTFVRHSVAAALGDDSPQILVSKFRVRGVDAEGDPIIGFADLTTDRPFDVTVETAEDQEHGRVLITASHGPRHLILSPNLTEEQREMVVEAKKGIWGDWQ